MSQKFTQTGFSLLEVMLAAALGLILLVALGQVYLSSKEVYRRQTELAVAQENIRFATFILTKNIREAGYIGCARLDNLEKEGHFVAHGVLPIALNFKNSVHGFSKKDAPKYLRNKMVTATDAIVIQKATADTTKLTDNLEAPVSSFKVLQNSLTKSNRILLLADCDHADFFEARATTGNTISLPTGETIQHAYQKQDSEVSRFTESAYFISKTSRKDARGARVYALYMSENRGYKKELLAGVNDLQIRYGIKQAGQGASTTYYSAKEITDQNLWSKVKSVQIDLTLADAKLKNKHLKLYIALRERSL